MPRPYPPEFRQRALDLVRSGRPVPEVAQLLGIAESCLYRWKRQDLIDRGLKPGTGQAESAELAAARKKIRDLEEENKILRKAAAAVEQVVPPKERYRLVAEFRADGVRVHQACYSLGVSTSGFYEWSRAPSARSIRHAWLTDLIRQVHEASYGTYGQPRVRAELQQAHGITISRKAAAVALDIQGLVDRLVRNPHGLVTGEAGAEPGRDLLRAPRPAPPLVGSPPVPPSGPRDVRARYGRAVRAGDCAAEPVLHVLTQMLVSGQLRDLGTARPAARRATAPLALLAQGGDWQGRCYQLTPVGAATALEALRSPRHRPASRLVTCGMASYGPP
jgi:transposase-like protein